MLRDEEFSSRAKVDRYGRKLPKGSGNKELEKFYRIEDEEEETSDGKPDEYEAVKRELKRVNVGEEDDVVSSSEDISSDEEELEAEEEDEVFGLLDEQADEGDGIPKGEVSSRLAVVNLDWDNIRATDLMAVFSSFTPGSGRITKVSVYPSEFGRERMEKEEMEGPPKDIFVQKKADEEQDGMSLSSKDDSEGEKNEEDERIKKSILKEDQGLEFNSAKLRRYQLERLRYYYAVLTCSSASVAQTIYDVVDGTEYLMTANFFDLRYIPDETDFSDDKPRDECERIPDGYRPNEFVTDALQHSKVKLTWDADDGTRKEVQKRAFTGSRADLDENDLKAYLGSDSSEDEETEPNFIDAAAEAPFETNDGTLAEAPAAKLSKKETERQRIRALLGLQKEPVSRTKAEKVAPTGDMQVTFSSGLSSEPKKGSVFENEPERDETTVEKYVRKEKERKARRKEKSKNTRTGADTGDDEVTRAAASDDSATEAPPPHDLGFKDAFFTAPALDAATSTSQRKAAKRLKKEQRLADEATSAAQRAELELLMLDDDSNAPSAKMQHFDINALAKAEKALRKKKKRRLLSEREKEALEAREKDVFSMDVGDERFRDVFERSEFAIDPSHPRFKGTEGMKKLLEEGRRKRKRGEDGEEDERQTERVRRRGVAAAAAVDDDGGGGDDVKDLVARVKGKSKAL